MAASFTNLPGLISGVSQRPTSGKSQAVAVLDRSLLVKSKAEPSVSAFAYLFSELIQYTQSRVRTGSELERKLEEAGFGVGVKVLELLVHREKANKRETRLLGMLSFIHTTVWRALFGKTADSLEKGTTADDEYMISDKDLLVNRYISVPKDMGSLNCGAYVAGIVRGALEAGGFPAKVEGQRWPRTTILIKFDEGVLAREARLEK